jgi:cysteinyl-tRNA synthetase
MIKKLEEKNLTYIADGNVYYDVSKFVHYRELGKLTFDAMKSTERVKDDTEKKNPQDFVLWFTQSKFKNHTMQWDSPWGRGYPGWHIECSAMSTKYLGEQFDIHCGGIDHIQVHHTNEIAQTEGATGKHPWVKYWMHSEFLVMNNGKMAKSDGSFITLQILKDKGYDPLVYRYFCMGTHYRQMLNFSYIALDNAKNAYDGLINRIIALKNDVRQAKNVKDVANVNNLLSTKSELMLQFEGRFLNAINDDLNIPLAVGIMHEVLRSNISITEKLALMLDFDKVFGLNFKDVESKSFVSKDETAVLKDLLDKRTEARKNKDWAGADKIRDEITAKGYVIKDTPAGPVLEKAN